MPFRPILGLYPPKPNGTQDLCREAISQRFPNPRAVREFSNTAQHSRTLGEGPKTVLQGREVALRSLFKGFLPWLQHLKAGARDARRNSA